MAELARAAGVGELVPVHHHPRRSAAELGALVAELGARGGVAVRLAVEGEPFELAR